MHIILQNPPYNSSILPYKTRIPHGAPVHLGSSPYMSRVSLKLTRGFSSGTVSTRQPSDLSEMLTDAFLFWRIMQTEIECSSCGLIMEEKVDGKTELERKARLSQKLEWPDISKCLRCFTFSGIFYPMDLIWKLCWPHQFEVRDKRKPGLVSVYQIGQYRNVNPVTGQIMPLKYGFHSHRKLLEQFYEPANNSA